MTNSSPVAIAGTAPRGVTVAVSGPAGVFSVPVVNDRFAADIPLKANSTNHVFFTTVGNSGLRSAPASTVITHDAQPPSLFIDFPSDGAELTTQTTDVAGRVSDTLSGFMGLTVTVNGIAAVVDVGVGTNGTFFAPAVPLTLGEPTLIVAVATDELGNSLTKQITITRIEIPPDTPQMAALSGNGQTRQVGIPLPEPIVVRVIHGDGSPFSGKVVAFEVTRSNGRLTAAGIGTGSMTLQVRTDVNGRAQAFWTLGDDAGCGNNRVEVTSTSIAGTIFFCASATPAPVAQINIGSGNSQRGEAGAPATEPLRVWLSDSRNVTSGNCRLLG